MKKIVILLLIMVMFTSGCGVNNGEQDNSPDNTQTNTDGMHTEEPSDNTADNTGEIDYESIEYMSGIYWSKDWDDEGHEYEKIRENAIPDKETAIDVAVSIAKSLQRGKGWYTTYVPRLVFYDEIDAFWVVLFYRPGYEFAAGDGLCIVMQQSDAKVLYLGGGFEGRIPS